MAFKKYNLSDKELAQLAAAAAKEQPSERGQKWEMCLMANLAEKRGYSNPRNFVINSGWFAKAARSAASGSGTTNQTKIGWARSIFNEGKRMIPSYIDEHDCFSDLTSAKNNGKGISITNRKAYIKDVTVIKNRYGSTWTFYGFPGASDDPFGYTKKGKEEDLYDDSTTSSGGSSQKVEDTSIGKPAKAFDLIVKSIGKVNIYSQTGINCGRDCYNTLLSAEEKAKITTYSTLVDAEKIWKTKYQPIVDAIDKLIDVGVINTKDYWYKHCEDIKYMPQLLIKMGKLNAYIDEVDMNIQTVDQALYKISMFVPGGLDINYWMNNYKKIQYLETLLIKGARQLKMNAESAIVMLINKGVINNGGPAHHYWEENYSKIPKLSDLLLRFAEWDYDTKTRPENVIPKIYQEQTASDVISTQKQVVDNRKIVTNGQAISQYFGFLNLNGLMTKQDYLYWVQHASSTNISYFAQLLYNVCSRVILKNKSIYDDAACDHIDLLNVDRENNGNKIDDAHHILYFNNGSTTVSQEYSKDIVAPSEQDNKIDNTTFTHYIPDLAIYGGKTKPTAINISNEIYFNVPLTQFLDVDENDENIEAFKVPDGVSYRNKIIIPTLQEQGQGQEPYYPLQSVKHFTLTAATVGTYVFCYQIIKEDGCAGIELYQDNTPLSFHHPKKVDKVTGQELEEEISNIYYYVFDVSNANTTLNLHLVITSQKNMAYVDKNYGVNWHFDLYNMTWGQTNSTSQLPKQYIPGLLGEPVVQFDGDEITYSNELQLPTQPLYGTSVGNVIRPTYNHLLPHSYNGYANLKTIGYIYDKDRYQDIDVLKQTYLNKEPIAINSNNIINNTVFNSLAELKDYVNNDGTPLENYKNIIGKVNDKYYQYIGENTTEIQNDDYWQEWCYFSYTFSFNDNSPIATQPINDIQDIIYVYRIEKLYIPLSVKPSLLELLPYNEEHNSNGLSLGQYYTLINDQYVDIYNLATQIRGMYNKLQAKDIYEYKDGWVKYIVRSYERNDNYYKLTYHIDIQNNNKKTLTFSTKTGEEIQEEEIVYTWGQDIIYDFDQWLNNNIDCEIKSGAGYNRTGVNDSYKPLQFDSKITVIPEGENIYYLNIGGVEKYKLTNDFTIYFRSADITINQNANADINLAIDKIVTNNGVSTTEREYWLSDVFYPSLGQIYRRVNSFADFYKDKYLTETQDFSSLQQYAYDNIVHIQSSQETIVNDTYSYTTPAGIIMPATENEQQLIVAGSVSDNAKAKFWYRRRGTSNWTDDATTIKAQDINVYNIYYYIEGLDDNPSVGSADEPAGTIISKIVMPYIITNKIQDVWGKGGNVRYQYKGNDYNNILNNDNWIIISDDTFNTPIPLEVNYWETALDTNDNPLPLQYIKPNLDKFTISETRAAVSDNDPGYFIAISRNHYSVYPHEEHPEVVEEQYDGVSAGSAAGGVDIKYDPDLEPQSGGN